MKTRVKLISALLVLMISVAGSAQAVTGDEAMINLQNHEDKIQELQGKANAVNAQNTGLSFRVQDLETSMTWVAAQIQDIMALDLDQRISDLESGSGGAHDHDYRYGPANRTLLQVATLQWPTYQGENFALDIPSGDFAPYAIAFDGTNLWTANYNLENVTRIDPATGIGTDFDLPWSWPRALAFDGTYIWTANESGNITRIDTATGIGTDFAPFGGGYTPWAIAFDGDNIWTANSGTTDVTRVDPATGIGTNFDLPVGSPEPRAIAFDGTYIWTANYDHYASSSGNVTRIDPATGIGTNFDLPGVSPRAIAFDGNNIWTANSGTNVTRINPATGIGTNFTLPSGANSNIAIAFDGTSMWTANESGNLTRIDPATGSSANVALPDGASEPRSIVFDGTNLWTANRGSNNVTKLSRQ